MIIFSNKFINIAFSFQLFYSFFYFILIPIVKEHSFKILFIGNEENILLFCQFLIFIINSFQKFFEFFLGFCFTIRENVPRYFERISKDDKRIIITTPLCIDKRQTGLNGSQSPMLLAENR